MNNRDHTERPYQTLPVLKSERLTLRKLTLDDAEDFFTFASTPGMTALNTWESPQTVEEASALIESMDEMYTAEILLLWGIKHKVDQRLIGICGFGEQSPSGHRVYEGIVMYRSRFYRGICDEPLIKSPSKKERGNRRNS